MYHSKKNKTWKDRNLIVSEDPIEAIALGWNRIATTHPKIGVIFNESNKNGAVMKRLTAKAKALVEGDTAVTLCSSRSLPSPAQLSKENPAHMNAHISLIASVDETLGIHMDAIRELDLKLRNSRMRFGLKMQREAALVAMLDEVEKIKKIKKEIISYFSFDENTSLYKPYWNSEG